MLAKMTSWSHGCEAILAGSCLDRQSLPLAPLRYTPRAHRRQAQQHCSEPGYSHIPLASSAVLLWLYGFETNSAMVSKGKAGAK